MHLKHLQLKQTLGSKSKLFSLIVLNKERHYLQTKQDFQDFSDSWILWLANVCTVVKVPVDATVRTNLQVHNKRDGANKVLVTTASNSKTKKKQNQFLGKIDDAMKTCWIVARWRQLASSVCADFLFWKCSKTFNQLCPYCWHCYVSKTSKEDEESVEDCGS